MGRKRQRRERKTRDGEKRKTQQQGKYNKTK